MPNPTLNQTCNSVRRPDLISLWPGRRPLLHASQSKDIELAIKLAQNFRE